MFVLMYFGAGRTFLMVGIAPLSLLEDRGLLEAYCSPVDWWDEAYVIIPRNSRSIDTFCYRYHHTFAYVVLIYSAGTRC